jgi:plastocyanin
LKVDNAREVVLPVDRTVRFDITSRDVLHSFWIPAFLLKIDAVPGLTTTISLKPTETGTFQEDPTLRLQCSQLCGLSHSRMRMPVRVVTQAEFDEWVKSQAGPVGGPTPSGPTTNITIVAKNILFDQGALTVPAGSAVALTVDNQDSGIPHNWSLYKSKDAAQAGEAPLAGTKIETGPVKQSVTFAAPAAGTYYFRCDVHPTTMTGTFVVQ